MNVLTQGRPRASRLMLWCFDVLRSMYWTSWRSFSQPFRAIAKPPSKRTLSLPYMCSPNISERHLELSPLVASIWYRAWISTGETARLFGMIYSPAHYDHEWQMSILTSPRHCHSQRCYNSRLDLRQPWHYGTCGSRYRLCSVSSFERV